MPNAKIRIFRITGVFAWIGLPRRQGRGGRRRVRWKRNHQVLLAQIDHVLFNPSMFVDFRVLMLVDGVSHPPQPISLVRIGRRPQMDDRLFR